ncbi:MAG: hypothetical protein ACK51E_07425 [Gemmatimonadota bacterium]|jgi:hypothetical protein
MRRKGRHVLTLLLAAVAVGCASAARPGAADGWATPREALAAFLAAAQAKDIDAMSRAWGGERGSAATYMRRDEREKRLTIMQCHLQHDSSRVLGEYPVDAGRRGFRVEMTFRGVTRATTMQAAPGPNGRWYLESADIEKTAEFCRIGGVGKT